MNLSRLYQSENDTKKAKEYLSKVLEIKDNLPEAANDLAYLLAEEGKDLQKALHLALFAESQGPEDPNVLDTLGWVYYKQKAYDLAIYKLSESVKRNPGSALSHLHLGWAYYDTGRYEQAREHMKTALKLDPNFKGGKEARNIIGQ
jgi:tetratricopeptide (TPR) repeat protein